MCDCGHKRFRHRVVASAGVERIETLVKAIAEKQDSIAEKQDSIVGALTYVVEDTLDPWRCIRSSDGSNAMSKDKLRRTDLVLQFYSIQANVCMILGECDQVTYVNKNDDVEIAERVINAHLWPDFTKGRGLNFLSLDCEEINSPRNFLRLHKTLESAFDRQQIVFDLVVENNPSAFRLKTVVLDPDLLDSNKPIEISASKTTLWRDIHNTCSHWEFQKDGKKPYTRVIAQHLHTTTKKAEILDWIQPTRVTRVPGKGSGASEAITALF
jgi:hypothetical protein